MYIYDDICYVQMNSTFKLELLFSLSKKLSQINFFPLNTFYINSL